MFYLKEFPRVQLILLTLGLTLGLAQAGAAMELQWLGHAAVKITSDSGKVILIDPFITKNPKTPEALKDLSKLGTIDLILVTHGHGDHVGDVVALAKSTGAKVGMNADMGHTFGTLGLIPYKQLIRFNKGGPIHPLGDAITITMVHAEHSSDYVYKDPATGNKSVHPGGEPAGYIIELENGFTVYHSGDTDVFTDMGYIRDYYHPQLALLPIGGHFTMDPRHAAYAVRKFLQPKFVIPIHFQTFKIISGSAEDFQKELGDMSDRLIIMQPGETRTF